MLAQQQIQRNARILSYIFHVIYLTINRTYVELDLLLCDDEERHTHRENRETKSREDEDEEILAKRTVEEKWQ